MTSTPRDRRRQVLPVAAVTAGLALVAVGVLPAVAADPVDVGIVPGPALPSAGAPPVSGLTPEPGPPPTPGAPAATPAPAPALGAAPVSVSLPSIGVSAPVVPVGLDDVGALAVPTDVQTLGWWSGGARLGGEGSTVIAGHVDSRDQGEGALYELARLEPGDPVVLGDRAGAAHAYVVEARRQVGKSALPPELFDRAGAHRLVLVTCAGEFDERTRSYADNVLVFAVPAPGPPS